MLRLIYLLNLIFSKIMPFLVYRESVHFSDP